MEPKNNGGPAFPNVPEGAGTKWDNWDQGMTLRDYFAAIALPAVVNAAFTADVSGPNGGKVTEEVIAAQAYYFADAMLAERAK